MVTVLVLMGEKAMVGFVVDFVDVEEVEDIVEEPGAFDEDAAQSNPLSCADTTLGGLEVASNSACQPHTILDPEACTLIQLRLLIRNVLESIFVTDPW